VGFFANLASLDESSKNSIAEAGAIPLLVTALRDCDNLDVKQASCSALRHLASNKHSCSVMIAENGGIEWTINAMKSCPKDPVLLATACGLLKELASFDEKYAESVSQDGVALVISVMGDHLSSAEVQEVACSLLALNCIHCGKKNVVEATQRVLSAMENHGDEVYVQIEACHALLRLSQSSSALKTMNELCASKLLSFLKDGHPEACGSLVDKLQELIVS